MTPELGLYYTPTLVAHINWFPQNQIQISDVTHLSSIISSTFYAENLDKVAPILVTTILIKCSNAESCHSTHTTKIDPDLL